MNQEIIISSDGSKSKCKSGGTWIIEDSSGKCVISGSGPDFEQIMSINSHRLENFGVLYTLLFIYQYCKYFMINFNSQVNYFRDNLEVVNRILQLKDNSKHYNQYINMVDHDTVYLLKHYLPSSFNIKHLLSHQDKRKT